MSRFLGAILTTAVLGASVPHAAAQPAPPESAEEQAKVKFQAGKQAFRLGEYDEAIALWKEAYRLKDNPAFLFNIGLAYREKGDLPRAVQFLENYLKDAPANASNRADVEARVKELKKLIEDQKAASKRPPNEPVELTGDGGSGTGNTGRTGDGTGGTVLGDGTTASGTVGTGTGTGTGTTGAESIPPIGGGDEPTDTSSGGGGKGLRLAGMATGGVGVVLLGAGVFFGLKASSAQSDVQAAVDNGDPWTEELDQKDADGRSAAQLSTITLGIGAAAVVSGGVLFYLGMRKSKAESSQLSVVPNGRGLTVVGSF